MITMMCNNVFEWGDMYFLQLLGMAMGTSAAVMWATIYFANHEVHQLIPVHGVHLFYFKCFIDDIFDIWIGNITTDWQLFCNNVNTCGFLTGDVEDNPPSGSVNFLDITLMTKGQRIVRKTFQKENESLSLPTSILGPSARLP